MQPGQKYLDLQDCSCRAEWFCINSTGRFCAIKMRDGGKWVSGCIIKVWFPKWPIFRGKMFMKKHSGPRSVSAVQSLEVVTSRRLAMYCM